MQRLSIAFVCVVLALAALYVITQQLDGGPGSVYQGEPEIEPSLEPTSTIARSEPGRLSVPVVAHKAPAFIVRVLDAVSRSPIPSAKASDVNESGRRMIALEAMTHSADESGLLRFAIEQRGQRIVVFSPGYIAGELVLDAPEMEIRLTRGHDVSVLVTSVAGSDLIEGIHLTISTSLISWAQHYDRPAGGDPAAEDPVWVARTDPSGRAQFYGIPAGDYELRVGSGTHCFTNVDGHGSYNYKISVPCGEVAIRVHESVGIVVATPTGEKIEHIEFSYDWGATQRSACNNRQRAKTNAEHLEERFPGSRAATTVPIDPHKPLLVDVFAITEQGVYTLHWAMTPMSRIDAPVFMEPLAEAQLGKLIVSIEGPSGSIDGIPIVAVGQDHKFNLVSGSPSTVLAGNYEIDVPARSVWLDDSLDITCYVAPHEQSVARATLPFDIAQLVIEIEASRDSFDIPLDIYAKAAKYSAIRTLMPGEKTVFTVPTGAVEVGVNGYGWKPITLALEAKSGIVPVTLSPQRDYRRR